MPTASGWAGQAGGTYRIPGQGTQEGEREIHHPWEGGETTLLRDGEDREQSGHEDARNSAQESCTSGPGQSSWNVGFSKQ